MGSTQPNPTRVSWVGHSDRLGWVEFFFTYHGGLGQKFPLTQPMHTSIKSL